MRNLLFSIFLLLTLPAMVLAKAPDKPIPIWPGTAPGEKGDIGEEAYQTQKPGQEDDITRLGNVSCPTISIHRPSADKDTGAAVVVCPGGGYSILAMNLEGEEVVEWLNSIGVTGILLKYRVPKRKDQPAHLAPLQDAQRALRIVRSNARDWGIDPNRIGIMGFSAGGHASAMACTSFDTNTYEPLDDIDKVSCRPDFAMLIYPAYLLNKDDKFSISSDLNVTEKTPPTIIVITGDDRLMRGAVMYYLALQAAKVTAELHVYPTGGHGYGLRPSANLVCTWPKRCEEWLQSQRLLSRK